MSVSNLPGGGGAPSNTTARSRSLSSWKSPRARLPNSTTRVTFWQADSRQIPEEHLQCGMNMRRQVFCRRAPAEHDLGLRRGLHVARSLFAPRVRFRVRLCRVGGCRWGGRPLAPRRPALATRGLPTSRGQCGLQRIVDRHADHPLSSVPRPSIACLARPSRTWHAHQATTPAEPLTHLAPLPSLAGVARAIPGGVPPRFGIPACGACPMACAY